MVIFWGNYLKVCEGNRPNELIFTCLFCLRASIIDKNRDAAHERLTLGFLKPLMSGERKIVLIKSFDLTLLQANSRA